MDSKMTFFVGWLTGIITVLVITFIIFLKQGVINIKDLFDSIYILFVLLAAVILAWDWMLFMKKILYYRRFKNKLREISRKLRTEIGVKFDTLHNKISLVICDIMYFKLDKNQHNKCVITDLKNKEVQEYFEKHKVKIFEFKKFINKKADMEYDLEIVFCRDLSVIDNKYNPLDIVIEKDEIDYEREILKQKIICHLT